MIVDGQKITSVKHLREIRKQQREASFSTESNTGFRIKHKIKHAFMMIICLPIFLWHLVKKCFSYYSTFVLCSYARKNTERIFHQILENRPVTRFSPADKDFWDKLSKEADPLEHVTEIPNDCVKSIR